MKYIKTLIENLFDLVVAIIVDGLFEDEYQRLYHEGERPTITDQGR